MNAINPVYNKYNDISNITYDLNDSVIVLKYKNYMESEKKANRYPEFSVSELQILKAKKQLMEILTLLESFYKEQNIKNVLYELIDNSFFSDQILNNPDYKNKLEYILCKLNNEKELSEKELSAIEVFISILNAEVNQSFHKQRTRR